MDEKKRIRKFIIASHGAFAPGAKSALDIIIGEMENIFVLQAYVGENKSIEDEVKAILENVRDEDELVVFTDLLGGSITNQILRCASQTNVHLVAGFNLGLLIEVLLSDVETPVPDILEEAIKNAKDQMVYVNKIMASQKSENQDD